MNKGSWWERPLQMLMQSIFVKRFEKMFKKCWFQTRFRTNFVEMIRTYHALCTSGERTDCARAIIASITSKIARGHLWTHGSQCGFEN